MALESLSTLTAAHARAESHLNLVLGQLATAKTSLQNTLRAAFVAGTAIGTTADAASADVARLEATATATQWVLSGLANDMGVVRLSS